MNYEKNIRSYNDAIEAIKTALNSPEINVDENHVHLFPWQKGQKGYSSRMRKIQRIQKRQRSLLDDAKHTLLDLLSLEEAKDVVYGLAPVYGNDKASEIRSNIKTGQEKRKVHLQKKAYNKLKRIYGGFYQHDEGIVQTPEGEYALAKGGYSTPTSLVDYTQRTIDAMDRHLDDFTNKRNREKYELSQGEKLLIQEENIKNSKALEIIEVIDSILNYVQESKDKRTPEEDRRFSLTDKEIDKALALREDLQSYMMRINEQRLVEHNIEALKYNLNLISERMPDFGYKSAGYNLLDSLYNEYKHELELIEARKTEILGERNSYDKKSLFTRVEDFLRYMDSSKQYQFRVDRADALRYVSPTEMKPEMPLEKKQELVLGAIKEANKTRTIYELYLREIAGKGKDRESFRDFAQKHNIENGFFEYENSLIEEQQMVKKL